MEIIVNSNIRLILTEMNQLNELFSIIEGNREHLKKYLSWVENKTSVESLATYIEESWNKYIAGTDISFAICYNEKIVGRIGIHYINQNSKNGKIGYWLSKSSEGKGIMTACCKKIIEYAFEKIGLERLELLAAIQNDRSRSIAQRLGFHQEGIMRKAELVNHEFLDIVLYAMLREDWLQLKQDKIHSI